MGNITPLNSRHAKNISPPFLRNAWSTLNTFLQSQVGDREGFITFLEKHPVDNTK